LSDLTEKTALELVRAVETDAISVEAIANAYLDRIAAREPDVKAWAYIDPDKVLQDARALDQGPRRGLLHGAPFAAKDIIDTADMPTGHGSPIYEGRQPNRDATCIALCRAAGGLLLGKTVTTEFAHVSPGATRNPHDPTRTPGGSSSGSAAAVGDRMAPLAFGTQTTGSVIRPASFCGVVGYKPSHGDFGLSGVGQNAPSFDTLGIMARDVADASLMRAAAMGAPYRSLESPSASSLFLGLCQTPYWDEAEPSTQAAIEEAVNRLARAGATVVKFPLPDGYEEVGDCLPLVSGYEFSRVLAYERANHPDKLSEKLLNGRVADGDKCSYADYRAALATIAAYKAKLADAFGSFNALLTPSAAGEAHVGLSTTGSPLFNGVWTALHAPVVTLPVLEGPNGLPVGLQLVGRLYKDDALLDVAGAVSAALA
jgi:Asp-tRNA(Asn)/Glu-tRNA(Gln) amidotransferase A subunit family amidase